MLNGVKNRHQSADIRLFILLAGALILAGILFVYSASFVFALETTGSPYSCVIHHLIGIALGLGAAAIAWALPARFWYSASPLIFLASIILTSLTIFAPAARSMHGSSRWLRLAGFAFQPSELLKFSLILFACRLLTKNHPTWGKTITSYVILFCSVGLTSLILLKQPDFGMTATVVMTIIALLFIANCSLKKLFALAALVLAAGIGLIAMRPYRMRRILTFLNPWQDPLGAGFQIIQSLIAIGSGGLTGLGIGQSKQKFFYLPMQHTDFIFSIIAEETGFIGSSILVLTYLGLVFGGIRLASRMQEPFYAMSTLGMIILIGLQAVINLSVAIGLVPTKGIGLPAISYGNSSLICTMVMISLIIHFATLANTNQLPRC